MASCVSYTPTWPVRGRAGPGLAAEARSFSSYGHHLLWASKTQKRRELSADSRVPLGENAFSLWARVAPLVNRGAIERCPGSDTRFTLSGSLEGEWSSLCKSPEHRLGKRLSSGFRLVKIEKLPGPWSCSL